MKCSHGRVLNLIAVTICCLNLTQASAGNGTSGGGTSVIIDDTVVLADPFLRRQGNEGTFKCKSGERGDLAPQLVEALHRAGSLLVHYGASTFKPEFKTGPFQAGPFMDNNINFGRSVFVESQVLNSTIEYCFVKKLPIEAPMDVENLPQDGQVAVIGYTEGNVTWIREDLFQSMNLREQVKTIIHERLHAYAGNVPHGPIADITNGVGLALSLYSLQSQGNRSVLNDDEVQTLTKLVAQIPNLRLDEGGVPVMNGVPPVLYKIVKNGGGLVHAGVTVSPSAFIGVGSVIGRIVGKIESNTVVLNSLFCAIEGLDSKQSEMVRVEDNAHIMNSEILNCHSAIVEQSAKIENSLVVMFSSHKYFQHEGSEFNGAFRMGKNSRLENSTLAYLGNLHLEQGALLSNVQIDFDVQFGSTAAKIHLEQYAQWKNTIGILRFTNIALWPWEFFGTFLRRNAASGLLFKSGSVTDFSGNPNIRVKICPKQNPYWFLGVLRNGIHEVSNRNEMRSEMCQTSGLGNSP